MSSDTAFSPNRTRTRTIDPRKLTSSTVPRIRFPWPGASWRDTISGRRATARASPAFASSSPRAAWTSCPSIAIAPRAGSTTCPRRMLSVPTNDATKVVRGKL